MICQLTIPGLASPVFLAGNGLISTQAHSLRFSTVGTPQQVTYVGAEEARQLMRGGSLTTVTFNSTQDFTTDDLARQFIITLQSNLADAYQQQCTALIAKRVNKVAVSGSLTPDATGDLQETGYNLKVYDSNELSAGYPRKLLRLDTSGTATAKLEYFANSGEYPGSASHTWSSTTAGSDADDPAGYTSWSTSGGTPAFNKTATDSPSISLYDCVPNVTASQIGISVNLDVTLVGRLVTA